LKLLLILHYPPPIHGAAVVGALIKESGTVNSSFDTKYINLSTSISIDDIGKQGLVKWWRYVGIILRTFFYGFFWRPQLVYITLTSHGLGLWKDAVIVAVCRLLGIKHVFHFHNKGVKKYANKSKKSDYIYRFVFKKAKVILLSPLLYPDIEDYVSIENVFFCPNGIPELDKKPSSTAKTINEPIQLLFLSNLIESKGIWDLLDACLYLKEKSILFNCDLVGGEGDVSSQELEKQIKERGLQEHVIYLGKQYGKEKTAILGLADIFIHPTHEDCFPLVLLEAMQFSLPIISTNEGAIPEIIKDGQTGFIIPKRNARALAEKLEILIQNSEQRITMGSAGRKKYEEEFTLESFEKRFISIIHQVI
jgi:glycosyltransferase involved in cell wall biosynthesis